MWEQSASVYAGYLRHQNWIRHTEVRDVGTEDSLWVGPGWSRKYRRLVMTIQPCVPRAARVQVGREPSVMFPKQSGQNHFKKEGAAGGEALMGSVGDERFRWSAADGSLKGGRR